MPDLQAWQQGLQALKSNPSEPQLEKLQAYLQLLQRWNKVYNLTAVRNPESMLTLHIFDSLAVADYIQGDNCLDVGSGAGLPGIPLAIMQPNRQFTMLDTNGKKTRFIQQAIIQLGLNNVKVVQTRVEEWQPEQKFSAIISRAFASIEDFVSSTAGCLQDNGIFYAMKGQLDQIELDELPKEFELKHTHPLIVPMLDAQRHLLEIRRRSC